MSAATRVAPPDVEHALETLVTGLRAADESNLIGIALYGGLAKGRFTPGISDVNVLVHVRDAGLTHLERLAPVINVARKSHEVTCLIATRGDLEAMARLFPIKIADMKAAHRVLFGDVGLDALAVDEKAIRLRALQDLRNTQFRLRQLVVERGGDLHVLWGALVRSLPKTAVIVESLLRMRSKQIPSERSTLLRAAARDLGVDSLASFASVHRHRSRPDDETARSLLDEYLRTLEDLCRRVEEGTSP